jgi:hypothetical protein
MKPPRSKTAAARARHVANTQRWRQRVRDGRIILPLEADRHLFDLLAHFGELSEKQADDRRAVADAVGRLLRRALVALLNEHKPGR